MAAMVAVPRCDNCGNDNDVQVGGLTIDTLRLLCFPCREAAEHGDDSTLTLRRMYLYDG